MKILTALFLIFSISCNTTSATIMKTLSPDLAIKKEDPVVVKEFSGKNGQEISSLIETALIQNGYTVLDRKNIIETAIAEGSYQAAKYVISGSVDDFSYQRKVEYVHTNCLRADGEGRSIETQGTSSRFSYLGNLITHISISNPKDNRIILSKKVEGVSIEKAEDSICESFSSLKPTPDEIIQKAKKEFEKEFLKLIIPYPALFEVTLFKVSEKSLPEVNQGNELFKKDKINDALRLYELATKKLGSHLSDEVKGHVYYSYGIALGYSGDPKYKDVLAKAMSLNPIAAYEKEYLRLEEIQPKIKHN